MRCTMMTLVAAISVLALVNSHPVPQERGFRSEALDRLLMVEADKEAALRSKRTIGILRQLFPDISQDVNPEAENRVNEVGSESQNNEVRVQFADEQSANEAVPNLTPLEDVESSDDENRNKRFLNFGLGASAGGSGAGSGNFLFDIIRLVAGSGSQSNSSGDASAGRTDGTQEAVPGPITRLFVIANRGISNLLQDLILRLAATSERIVNFKARLITSII
ncbi:uncharacterized protein LOC118448391 isoform X1 [Vespa mandarinia]|uniref:uncharacterized protein LOC118448391 isoform X1 n=1 Tax=Vespa mandarinia TaxID=7446 RepID=UPI001609C1F4|nr:uncharacterized protein LOC118448391 isoform X1 [Vespa mandarinia]XP_035737485.1 uncharacterized protein LOC118448391 isoform X1 [Vespa mandarinia]